MTLKILLLLLLLIPCLVRQKTLKVFSMVTTVEMFKWITVPGWAWRVRPKL